MRTSPNPDPILMALAAVLLAIAILMTFLNVGRTSALTGAFEKKRSQRLELLDLKARLAREQSALDTFNALPDPKAIDPLRLAADALDGATPQYRELGATQLADGWNVRQIELAWAEIPLDKAWKFLARAESNRPPWRLVEYRITSDSQRAGTGRLALVLETLEKATAERP